MQILSRLCENFIATNSGASHDAVESAHVTHRWLRPIANTAVPESLDDYVAPDNPVRFIDAFVDGLDLATAGFADVEPKATGLPGYTPADLLKLYIYGYLNRVRSSRRLEAETHRNVEAIWLLRHLKPDFKTIADFRCRNCDAFRQAFRQFVLLCRELELFGRELLAVDGTRLKAVNNKDRNFTRASLAKFIKAADAALNDYLQRLDAATLPRAARMARGSGTWPRSSPRCRSDVSGTPACWRSWIGPAKARSMRASLRCCTPKVGRLPRSRGRVSTQSTRLTHHQTAANGPVANLAASVACAHVRRKRHAEPVG